MTGHNAHYLQSKYLENFDIKVGVMGLLFPSELDSK